MNYRFSFDRATRNEGKKGGKGEKKAAEQSTRRERQENIDAAVSRNEVAARGRQNRRIVAPPAPRFCSISQNRSSVPDQGATRVACTPGVTIGYRDTPRKTVAARHAQSLTSIYIGTVAGNARPRSNVLFHVDDRRKISHREFFRDCTILRF